MESFITLIIIGLLLVFGNQLLRGIGNILAVVGRVGGWILGIILVIIIIKFLLFG